VPQAGLGIHATDYNSFLAMNLQSKSTYKAKIPALTPSQVKYSFRVLNFLMEFFWTITFSYLESFMVRKNP
jgi:hypothetical protein